MKLENIRNARRRHLANVKAVNLRQYNKACLLYTSPSPRDS